MYETRPVAATRFSATSGTRLIEAHCRAGGDVKRVQSIATRVAVLPDRHRALSRSLYDRRRSAAHHAAGGQACRFWAAAGSQPAAPSNAISSGLAQVGW